MKTITYTLKDIASYITDGKHGDCMDQDDSGFYFISSKDVNGDEINYQDARQITENDFLETNKRTRYEPNDILLTNSGTIGRMAIAKDIAETKRTTFQKSVAIIKPNKHKVLPLWLYYYLKANIYILGDIASGAAQKNLLLKDIRAFKVNVPECAIQKSIITMLSPYYDIIEKNNRQIQLLEESARLLFREWFVYFHFPGHEKVKIVDGVPEGWEKGNIHDISEVKSGYAFNSKDWIDEGNPVIKIGNIIGNGTINLDDCSYINQSVASKAKSFTLKKGDLLIAMTGATVGKVGLLSENEKIAYLNQRVGKFIPKFEGAELIIYCFFMGNTAQNHITNYAGGAAQANISASQIESIKIFVAPQDIYNQFINLIEPMFEEILNLRYQNQKLTQARDLLLPRLMSGEIEV